MKMRKLLLFALVLLLVLAGYGVYIWNKPARNVAMEKGIEVSAVAIFDSFNTNEQRANSLYLNKAIQVTGKIADIKKNESGHTVIYLQTEDPVFGVNCTLVKNQEPLTKGDIITFKGICTGFLNDVVINEGIIIK